MLGGALAQHTAQNGNVLIQIVLLDDGVRPDRAHQFILVQHTSRVLNQVHQRVKCLRRNRDRTAIASQQEAPAGIQAELTEFIDVG